MKVKTGTTLTKHYLMGWTMTTLTLKRYEIYFAELKPILGSEISKIRPVVIISDDTMNKYLEIVVVCPITSKIHPTWRTRPQIDCGGKQAEIAVDQIRTISKTRIKNKIDQLPTIESSQLRRIITEMYGE
jgi:mRNA interferase MazF